MKILLATTSAHKIREILAIWGKIPFQILTLKDFPDFAPVDEDGNSFEENAFKKAREACRKSKILTLSDDSGIEVDVLGGQPGIHSARYAGTGASDEENLEKLIHEMKGFSNPQDRKARYRCVAALVDPSGDEKSAEGSVEGVLLEAQMGVEGFGYDPIFYVPSLHKTFSQVSLEEKNRISHRALAFRKMKEILLEKYSAARS